MGKIRSFLGYAGPGIILAAILGFVVPSFWLGASASAASGEESGWKYISAKPLLDDIKVLASDKFEGRAPATEGEKLALSYLQKRFREIGLEPGNPYGTYLQKVPMVGITANSSTQLVFTKSGSAQKNILRYGDEFVAWTKRMEPTVQVDAPLVFVGYGVVAPEYHWDDYKGVDVKGKILVMLVNDPAVPDPHDPSKLDPRMFKGKAMTYYGRWTYKYEIAAKMGAAGALVIHETGPAGYPWGVVKSSNTGEQFDLVRADRNRSHCAIEGWITREQAVSLFQLAGKNFDTIKKSAVSPNFHPVRLGVKAELTLHNRIRTIDSYNVVGKVVGSDPKLKNQYVIYTAHWDHLGIGPAVNGDRIYNGAVDNASGVGGLIELAKAFTRVQPRPKRSILFLSVTAEEKGLLGSEYYAENPLYPLTSTLANINMDVLNVHGRTRDIGVIGLGMSSLDEIVKAVAKEQQRVVKPDAEPEKGFYYRSDHFEFAKQGVPALDTDAGTDFIGRPPDWGLKMRNEYTTHLYHTPSDEVKPDWDLSGAVEDLRLLFSVGYRVANTSEFPAWSAGSEFKAKRQQMLRQAGASK
ncbi:MAG TPA: M28 family metallopeptidase [Terriglobia bacterium]|nr:M28 family metallopeptidase [Terriglobia bacterium]